MAPAAYFAVLYRTSACFPVLGPATYFPAVGMLRLHVFPALGIGYIFPRPWHRLDVFPRLASVTCFSALGIGCIFSRAWHRVAFFPHLALVAYSPVLGTGCMFSCAWHRLRVFPRLVCIGCMFFRAVACFPALETGCMFSRA